jgi:hypothetical protein
VVKVGLEARRFRAEAVVDPPRGGHWGASLVKVFDGDVQVGDYERNYPSFATSTFEPFEQDGRWYALYSRHYTATRVMRLPDCTDLGGEEPATHGFCPVELYVPRYRKVSLRERATGKQREDWSFEDGASRIPVRNWNDLGYDVTIGPWESLTTGFVAGCIWGDDRSWKLEVIDLSKAADGEIVRSARFGYLELPDGMSLAEAISLDRFMPRWELRATVIRRERRDVTTGALIDPCDE